MSNSVLRFSLPNLILFLCSVVFSTLVSADTVQRNVSVKTAPVGTATLVSIPKPTAKLAPLSLLNESLWQKLKSEFEFSNIENDRIDGQIIFLQSGLRSLRSNLFDASPYLYYILEQIERAGVPADIALLPLIESAFNPTALSSESAVGIWQFIPATASHYGLSIDKHYDQRKDVMASTTAAIRYLTDLHRTFDGDWLLALAAYNTGPGNVRTAMRRAVVRGDEPNYWNLKLSTETSNYVPRLIAATKMISNPQMYGLELPPLPNRKQIESIAVGRRISLNQVVELTDISIKEITALNPGFHEGMTPVDGPHILTLPVEISQQLLSELNKFKRQPLIDKQSNFTSVSRVSTSAFIIDTSVAQAGNTTDADVYMPYKAYHYKTHIVERGDSLWKVADKLDVTIPALRYWNDLEQDTKSIQAGDKLNVAYIGTDDTNPEKAQLMNYRVGPRDTLVIIANKFDLHLGDIKRWNKSLWHKNRVQAGQVLRIPTAKP